MEKKRIVQVVMLLMMMVVVMGSLFIQKKIRITPKLAGKFEMTGVDVSHYQGTIDWAELAGQDLDFAFIKATEGSGHIDECFYDNWQEAEKTALRIGAYHFFSFDSDGESQAEAYIDTVGSLNGKIAPAVDVEFYGDKADNPPPKDEVVKQLGAMLRELEEHYQAKPIIYTTYKAYDAYIKGEFEEYPLWIRNVYYQPLFSLGDRWVFWQYTDTAVLEGYEGTEQYIDMNVFRGTEEELKNLLVQSEAEGCSVEETASNDSGDGAQSEEDAALQREIEEEILAGRCNLVYETEQTQIYSHNDTNGFALYVRIPEKATVIYPVQNFWVDEEQQAVWLLDHHEEIQIRKVNLRQGYVPEETLVFDESGIEAMIADTYGLVRDEGQAVFRDLHAVMSGKEENGNVYLGGTVSGVYKETNKKFEIVYEIDRASGEVGVKGYLQDLEILPLYQEFLLHNLTVENPFVTAESILGKELSFFDDEVYLSGTGKIDKQFALTDENEDGMQELVFRLVQEEGKEEVTYVLEEMQGKLICKDIWIVDASDEPEDVGIEQSYMSSAVKWYDCASFIEIPTGECKEYKSRDEVYAAVEAGDFSVVTRKYADPDRIVESLKEAYELDGDTRRTARCDIDGDGFEELLLLIQYEFEDYERIDFILDYRNGRAVCTYYDWCDGNEWLLLGSEGKLIHCISGNNGSCKYYGLKECTLSAGGIKEIDDTGYGIEVCNVNEPSESGLWWWDGQKPEITQRGLYFAEVRTKNEEEINDTGTAVGWVKKLIAEEQYLEKYKELTGEDFALSIDLEKANIIFIDIEDGVFGLGYTERDRLLEDCGFNGKEPFYQYHDENGELQLELYYNEGTCKGCGIRYDPGGNQNPQGFKFDGSKMEEYDSEFLKERLNADPYELLANGGVDLAKDEWIDDYEENIEYLSDGRPKHFKSQGWITYVDDEHETQKLLEIEFTYREDGTLRRRDYAHNMMALETWHSVTHSFYDTQERLLYEDCYITHGSMDYYYIYQDDKEQPTYCLMLDHDLGVIHATMVKIE